MVTENTLQLIAIGSFLGLTAGLSPGPLLTLVITETIKHNKKEGIKIALSPLITDLPIVLITLFLFSQLSQFNNILGGISFVGAVFVAYLAYESFNTKRLNIENPEAKANSLKKGIITNFVSPHPYLFWATIGTPYAFKAFEISIATGILFFVSFYLFLVGSKIAIANIVARTKVFIGQKLYSILMKILGIALFIFSLLFVYDGLKYFHIV